MRSSINLLILLLYVVPGGAAFAQDTALRGKMAMSAYVDITGDKDISPIELRLSIEEQLHQIGIIVYPHSDAPKYPVLHLTVEVTTEKRTASTSGGFSRNQPQYSTVVTYPYTVTVALLQTGPDAAIWSKSATGTASQLTSWVIGDEAIKEMIGFVNAWVSANGHHSPTPDVPNQPQVATKPGTTAADLGLPLYKSEIKPVGRGSTWGLLYEIPVSQRDMVEQEVKDLITSGQKTIQCEYGPSNTQTGMGFEVFHFWYAAPPANILKLLTSAYRHPMMEEGRVAVSACPAYRELAFALYDRRFN